MVMLTPPLTPPTRGGQFKACHHVGAKTDHPLGKPRGIPACFGKSARMKASGKSLAGFRKAPATEKLVIMNLLFKLLTQPIGYVYFFEGIHIQADHNIVTDNPWFVLPLFKYAVSKSDRCLSDL